MDCALVCAKTELPPNGMCSLPVLAAKPESQLPDRIDALDTEIGEYDNT